MAWIKHLLFPPSIKISQYTMYLHNTHNKYIVDVYHNGRYFHTHELTHFYVVNNGVIAICTNNHLHHYTNLYYSIALPDCIYLKCNLDTLVLYSKKKLTYVYRNGQLLDVIRKKKFHHRSYAEYKSLQSTDVSQITQKSSGNLFILH